jgi:hypothetical protein
LEPPVQVGGANVVTNEKIKFKSLEHSATMVIKNAVNFVDEMDFYFLKPPQFLVSQPKCFFAECEGGIASPGMQKSMRYTGGTSSILQRQEGMYMM